MVLHLDGKKVPKIFMGNSKIYDVEELPEPELVKDNLLLHYDFSQGDNTSETREIIEDLSGNGNHGVLHNFNFDENSGYVENGLRFDGVDDYIEFDEIVLNPSQDFTIEAVISDVRFEYGNYGYIISDGVGFGKGLRIGSTNVYLKTGNDYYSFFSNRPIPNHIVHTHNEEKVISRLNGLINRTNTTVPQESSFMMKQLSTSYSSYRYQGVIHSIRIYKRELSEEELAINYTIDNNKYFGIPLPEPSLTPQLKLGQKDISLIYKGDKLVFPNHTQDGLKLWFDFSSMAGDPLREFRVKDLSGNGNDGSLANFKFDGTDGYMDRGLMFNGEGSEVNFPKIAFEADEDWTVELLLGENVEEGKRIIGGKAGNTYISLGAKSSSTGEVRFQYVTPGNSIGSFYPLSSPTYIVVTKKDNSISIGDANSYGVSEGALLNTEDIHDFDNLGNPYRGNNNYAFKGLIHAVRVYDRVLTQEEVAQNYKSDKGRYES